MAMISRQRTCRIDFSEPSLRRTLYRSRPGPVLVLLLGILSIAGALGGAQTLHAQRLDIGTQSQKVAAQVKFRKRPATVPGAPAITVAEADAVNAAVAQLNLPWHDVFRAIETATPMTVALLELVPDAKRHVIKGVAEAASSEEMLAYITRLGNQPFFASVVLTRHEVNQADNNKPLRFQFLAQWEEAAP